MGTETYLHGAVGGSGVTLAHALSPGGPQIEALVIALVLIVLAFVLRARRITTPSISIVPAIFAIGLFVSAFVAPNPNARAGVPPGASIAIGSPVSGGVVPADEDFTIQIELTGLSLIGTNESSDPRRGHIHVYVDGGVVAMPTTLRPTVSIPRGEHEIEVEFVRADHTQFSPRVVDSVTVRARTESS